MDNTNILHSLSKLVKNHMDELSYLKHLKFTHEKGVSLNRNNRKKIEQADHDYRA